MQHVMSYLIRRIRNRTTEDEDYETKRKTSVTKTI